MLLKINVPTFRHHSAFTLIELLIVVAIVALLSAIAVPNFLEAQTRAKVSRTKADLRSLATGLETYRTDYRGYPIVGNPSFPSRYDLYIPYMQRLQAITTPIAYVTTIPADVFAAQIDHTNNMGPYYSYAPGNLYHGATAKFSGSAYRNTIYSISGRGPDTEINAGGYCLSHPTAYEDQLAVRGSYDPTNGTISQGDVVQLSCGRL